MLFGTTSRLSLMALAVLIGALLLVAGNIAVALVLGDPVIGAGVFGSIDAPDVALLQYLTTALPMLLLALGNVRRWRFWVLAITLTTLFWSYLVWQIWRDSLIGFAGGANIGLGLIMLLSPLLTMACVGILRLASGPEEGYSGADSS